MSSLPGWIQIFQALLTPAIAVAVGVIAFLQWRTAHQKVVLDLFDLRLAVYQKIRKAMAGINTSALVTDETTRLLLEAESEARFLFGPEIVEYVENFYFLCIRYRGQTDGKGNVGPLFAQAHKALMGAIGEFYNAGPDRFAPYMKMDQKRVGTPAEWLSQRNKMRLSYADEKQR